MSIQYLILFKLKLPIQYSILFKLKLPIRLETLIKKRKVERLMNLIYVAYTIGNFDKKMPILVIFSESAHLRKYQKKLHHFGKIPKNEKAELWENKSSN